MLTKQSCQQKLVDSTTASARSVNTLFLVRISVTSSALCSKYHPVEWAGRGSVTDRRTWKSQLRSPGVRGACASVSDLKPILVLSATHLLWLVIPKHRNSRCLWKHLDHSLKVWYLYYNATQTEAKTAGLKKKPLIQYPDVTCIVHLVPQ